MMIWSDLTQLVSAIPLIIGAVLPVDNPLGDAPIFPRTHVKMNPDAEVDANLRVVEPRARPVIAALEGGNLCLVLKSQTDLIQSFQQHPAA